VGLALAEKIAKTFRAYDVRGVYGEVLDLEVARHLGYGIARWIGGHHTPTIAVCRDVRLSSPELAAALIDGLVESGVDVIDLGEGPTPLLYFAAKTLDVAGGVMVTGSHNPPEQNGFKVWLGGGNVFGDALAEIGELALMGAPGSERSAGRGSGGPPKRGSVRALDLGAEYRRQVLESAREGLVEPRPLKIAVDCGNGTAGPYVVELLEALGCEVHALFVEPDGSFPNHHPDPTVPDYLHNLRDTVIANDCELGIGFDGDADRLGAVDAKGDIVFADRLLYLFGKEVAAATPDAEVIGDVKCSDVVFDGLREAGADAVMSRTGHSFIKQRMKDDGAALAGEMSGHFFFADRYFGYDDAVYAACRLAVLLMNDGKSLSEALAQLPETASTPEIRLECAEQDKGPVLARLERVFDDALADHLPTAARDVPADREAGGHIRLIDKTDGLRVSFDDGWCLIRPSNTEAILVLRFEGLDESALGRIERLFLSRLAEAAPELEAPLSELLEVCV